MTIRVFPRKTKLSPDDDSAWFSGPEIKMGGNGEPVEVSCACTYDKSKAEQLAEEWAWAGYAVTVGGPAYDDAGGNFTPGQYLAIGNVITSRGCNNNCWFCMVPRREGSIRELPICDGWNVLDSNLLQCSEQHIRQVFAMLERQERAARFTGGLETAILEDWHIDMLVGLKPERFYFAYDTADDFEPLVCAARKVRNAGFRYWHVGVYVLVGGPRDTMAAAEKRLQNVCRLGLKPMAMLWRGTSGKTDVEWSRFQREWANHTIVGAKMKQFAAAATSA